MDYYPSFFPQPVHVTDKLFSPKPNFKTHLITKCSYIKLEIVLLRKERDFFPSCTKLEQLHSWLCYHSSTLNYADPVKNAGRGHGFHSTSNRFTKAAKQNVSIPWSDTPRQFYYYLTQKVFAPLLCKHSIILQKLLKLSWDSLCAAGP